MRVVYYLFLLVTTISFMAYIVGKLQKGKGVQLTLGVLKILTMTILEMT